MDFADTSPVALVLSLVIGYLSGSVPYGLLLTQMAGLGDVRKIGSGNIGATNVLRTGNKKLAALTVLLDGLKGTVPVALANHFLGLDAAILAGLGAFLGHLYPVWLALQGRQGHRHLRRHLARLFVARAAALRDRLDRHGDHLPILVARRTRRQRGDDYRDLLCRTAEARLPLYCPDNPRLLETPPEHFAPAVRHGKQDRIEGLNR